MAGGFSLIVEPAMHLTLYFREYCGPYAMRDACVPYQQQHGFTPEVIDVDNDPALVERFDELVPVLMHGDTDLPLPSGCRATGCVLAEIG